MARGKPAGLRLETVERTQQEFRQSSLDDLLSADHVARHVWDYAEGLDLGVLYGRVRTTVQSTGRPAIDPALLVSLWLYATLDGVGSARLLDRLCKSETAYRWLCGGVSVNYHTLSDFRGAAGAVLDDVLSRSIAGLIEAGLIDATTVAVDGVRVWASAGKGSLRREERLAALHKVALEELLKLRIEIDEDSGSGERRRQVRKRAVQEDRVRRLEAARAAAAEIETNRQKEATEQRRKEKKNANAARGSTTDPQARVMKMADGSFKPAYNIQFKTVVAGPYVMGVSVSQVGSDRGQLQSALGELKERYEITPQQVLADGGYDSHKDIEWMHEQEIPLFCPLPKKTKYDPTQPQPKDGPGAIAWRQRMADTDGQKIYRRRWPTERPHAHMRNHGLRQLLVRGVEKVKAVVLLHAIAFNFLQFKRLGWI